MILRHVAPVIHCGSLDRLSVSSFSLILDCCKSVLLILVLNRGLLSEEGPLKMFKSMPVLLSLEKEGTRALDLHSVTL
jgi:hypothetical protein